MNAALDVIVVGGGIAGMAFATRLVDRNDQQPVRVRIFSKAAVEASNSFAAQGGVAAVMRLEDSFEQHIRDTMNVGAGRNDPDVVRLVVGEGPAMIRSMIDLGAHFDSDATGRLQLAREGGHSMARVVHHRDRTGEEIVRVLQARVRSSPHIEVIEPQRALDLLVEGEGTDRQCRGIRAMDLRSGDVMDHFASLVVLATGGAGQVYERTTNPIGATGDGVAMAIRADVDLRDMAFVQFHPTALHTTEPGPAFLISEAVRGAGARLSAPDGRPLMKAIHDMGDLAPRNVIARAIHREMQLTGSSHLWLDASPMGVARFAMEFPAIEKRCREMGIVAGRDRIPVVPAAHYMCGGIRTDDSGRTALKGLFALGECASSGLHGADRLASNSLLEALVIPKRAAGIVFTSAPIEKLRSSRPYRENWLSRRTSAIVTRALGSLRHAMSTHVGIIREEGGMLHTLCIIAMLERQIAPIWNRRRWSPELIDLRDLLVVARSITSAALAEPASMGAHYVEVK
ncbi:MAG: L-aspartate oxidase [Flavobacteriales bacterium]|nr:L-aspartate oxidase [Flavobacteriales bacterium]